MIGVRLTPHYNHSTAVLVRVVAAFVAIATLVVIPVTLAEAALGHVSLPTALIRMTVAVALTAATTYLARRFDPLRA